MTPIRLSYGKSHLIFTPPDQAEIRLLSPRVREKGTHTPRVLGLALDHPTGARRLEEMAKPGMKAAVMVDDATRPTPVSRMLPLVLDRLEKAGIAPGDTAIVLALGTHRPMTDQELELRLGPDVLQNHPVENRDSTDESGFVYKGKTSGGIPAWVNKTVARADLRIGLGMISPHTDTGYSGGAKIILPGVCAAQTIGEFHTRQTGGPPVRLGDESAALRLELEAFVEEKLGLDFIFNVVLDARDQVWGAVAGHYVRAHRKGCAMAEKALGIGVEKPFSLVVSNAWPNQNDLWQSTKAISCAAGIVEPGGNLILLAHAGEGVSNHPLYPVYIGMSAENLREVLGRGDSPDPVACALALDIARIRENLTIHLVSAGLTAQHAETMGFVWHETLEKALASLVDKGKKTRVGVITHGGTCHPFIDR